jgi:5-methylcytosine-specific restriction endonuclease McrA
MHIEILPLTAITPYARNPRRNQAAISLWYNSITHQPGTTNSKLALATTYLFGDMAMTTNQYTIVSSSFTLTPSQESKKLYKKEYDFAYYRTNKDKIIDRKKEYIRINREKLLEGMREYRIKNKEKLKEYRQNNSAIIAERYRQYSKDNPEKISENRRSYRARKYESNGTHTAADIKLLLFIQKNRCIVCRISIKNKYHIDHIIPLALGGSNDKNNLQLLCPHCNFTKSSKHPVDFMQENGFLL